jgi:ABC-type sugar transport system permease subunit
MAPILNLVVQNIRDARFGAAAATGWIIFVLIAGIAFVQFRILQERED